MKSSDLADPLKSNFLPDNTCFFPEVANLFMVEISIYGEF